MFRDRIFWIIQGVMKYLAFDLTRRLRSWAYRPFFLRCGINVRIEDGVTIKYPSRISLGDDTVINQNCFLNGFGGLRIGSDVMIGNNTTIITTSHVTDAIDVPMRQQGIDCRQTIIEDDVWIGNGVAILAGALVGSHSIIGTGAVVLGKEYPAYAVLGGVPVRILKMRSSSSKRSVEVSE
jgi:acetyltransferase-like isoleucine patch superfamily enzyme